MLLLGLLAVIQNIFLPGFLILHLFKVRTQSIIQKLIYIFALSLFANYALVTILVLSRIYIREVMLSIIIVEIIVITVLIIKKKIIISNTPSIDKLSSFLRNLITQNSLSVKLLVIASIIIILFYLSLFISNIGTIFYFVDTVNNIHWNTWAIDFSNNIFPKQSSHFPQLIPANWSISYLLIDEANVHFFPKSFMPLFFFANLLMFFDLAIDKKKYVYLIALVIYGLFAPIIYNLVFIADGNGDLPVSFFAFLSFYAYLKTDKEKFQLKEFIIIFLFASTAAGTKLAGFYVFFFMSIICLYYLLLNIKSLSKKEIGILIGSVILMLSVNLFWYFMKPEVMTGGLHQPEWLAETYAIILKKAFHLLYYNWGLPVLAFFILTFSFSLFVKESRYITIFFVIPPLILWMFKYSSDFRNLSFVVPFISYVSAFGVSKILEVLKNKKESDNLLILSDSTDKNYKRAAWTYILFFVIGMLCFFLIRTDYAYQILYSTYSLISKYYFQSNRITYFTDFTFFVHVDYYQKVFSMMFLVFASYSIVHLLKINLKYLFILILFGVTILNFTLVTESQIIKHQQNEFDIVDARNYYFRVNTILQGAKLDRNVFTNFKSICSEKVKRNIEFSHIENNRLLKYLEDSSEIESKIIFIKLNELDNQRIEDIRNLISSKKFQILFDDRDYILISS